MLTLMLIANSMRNRKKCYFIGYGDEPLSYHFLDDQSWRIIRSKNVIFNEKFIYKDKSYIVVDTTSQEFGFIILDKLLDNKM